MTGFILSTVCMGLYKRGYLQGKKKDQMIKDSAIRNTEALYKVVKLNGDCSNERKNTNEGQQINISGIEKNGNW